MTTPKILILMSDLILRAQRFIKGETAGFPFFLIPSKLSIRWILLLGWGLMSCRGPAPDLGRSEADVFPEFPEADRFYQAALDFEEDENWAQAADMLDSAILILSEGKIRRDSLGQRQVAFHQLLLEEYAIVFEQLGTQGALAQSTDELPWESDTLAVDSEVVEHIPELIRDVDFSKFEMKVDVNSRVLEQIYYLAYGVPSFVETSLSRLGRYESLIDSMIQKKEVPKELKYLALVESGYKTTATSSAKAAGMWQFIPSTARHYGMDVTWWLDERRDPEKSTSAAFSYLKNLYEEFGDWYLAIAAYNCGEGRVRRQIKAQGTRDYWELDLPKETKNYVPRILAAIIIASNPQKYGLKVEREKELAIDTVRVRHCMDLGQISHALAVEKEELRLMNPELRQQSTPPRSAYLLRLPEGRGDFFQKYYDAVDKSQLVCQEGHRVRGGENLSVIARKYGVSVSAIKSANNMRNSRIWPNQILYIPIQGGKAVKHRSAQVSRDVVKPLNSVEKSPKPNGESKLIALSADSYYRVIPGDNLYSIGRRIGASVTELMEWNDLQPGAPLKIGQKILIRTVSSTKPAAQLQYSGKKQVYRVQNGDNLYQISRKLGVKLNDLLKWNQLEGRAVIRKGDLLVYYLPNDKTVNVQNNPTEAHSSHYKVQNGDTLWGISQKFGIAVEEIIRLNQLESNRIDLGQVLRIRP